LCPLLACIYHKHTQNLETGLIIVDVPQLHTHLAILLLITSERTESLSYQSLYCDILQ